MEEHHIAARSHLRDLDQKYPHWSHVQMAIELGYSVGWVKKWRKRLRQAPIEDDTVLYGQSRRHMHYRKIDPQVVKRITELRQELFSVLKRVPGPKAILYYLHKEDSLKSLGVYLPTSTSTIWAILVEAGAIHRRERPKHIPLDRPEPMHCLAMDFKDVSTISPQGTDKRQHQVEILNVVDEGTSFWLDYHVRTDFSTETILITLTQLFSKLGIPPSLRMDRDPRFVGPAGMGDFPSAVQRFLAVFGIQARICPPHQPQKNPFVERLHGNLNREWLQFERPTQLKTALPSLEKYYQHYIHERPHQGRMAQNRPLSEAFPNLPTLPALPQWVEPDRWLNLLQGKIFMRRVRANGSITLDNVPYYIQKQRAKETVLVQVDPMKLEVVVSQNRVVIKWIPLKGVSGSLMTFDDYLERIRREARREDDLRLKTQRRKLRQLVFWS